MNYLRSHPSVVAQYLWQHVWLVTIALVIAIAIALPASIVAARNKRVEAPLLGTLGVIYTIPSLALLALLVQYVGLGFWTAVVVLVAYAQFILVRNFVAGLHSVAPAQLDAAMGLGMSANQRLLSVQLPQALPVMLAGVRIAVISLIAIATLAGYVNAGGLGTLIFYGLETNNIDKTIAGSIPAMLLAIVVDLLFRLRFRSTARGSS